MQTIQLIKQDKRLQWILFTGFIVQVITCITQVGFYQDDQHFQIIEFSQQQLGNPSGAKQVWEFNDAIRPTLQVYMFSGYQLLCEAVGIFDPFAQLLILRIITGIVLFCFFNLFTLHFLKDGEKRIIYWTLLLLNFSWSFPFIKTLFNSEMISALFFFGALILYDINKEKKHPAIFILIGFILSLSFYLRFQIGFAIAGFGIWFFLFDKGYSKILPLFIGFGLGVVLNTFLDYEFYHRFVFTPYNYFHSNINEGKAASFGTSSFVVYIYLILAIVSAPPLSILLIYYSAKSFSKNYTHIIFLPVILFIVAHCFVGHKEGRFLFPVFLIFPLMISWGLPSLLGFYQRRKWFRYFFKPLFIVSILINLLILSWGMLVPLSTTIEFDRRMKNYFQNETVTVYGIHRLPTLKGKLHLMYYSKAISNIQFEWIPSFDSLKNLPDKETYFATTFDQIEKHQGYLDSIGYKPVLYSSTIAWRMNELLASKHIRPIQKIWVLYKKNPPGKPGGNN